MNAPCSSLPSRSMRLLALCLAGFLVASATWAAKPEGAGPAEKKKLHPSVQEHGFDKPGKSDKSDKPGKSGKHAKNGKTPQPAVLAVGGYFQGSQRSVAQSYYSQQFSTGRCPPGLAKKNNGCMPPGQARKWSVGQPLPRDVVYYAVPPALVVQLGSPPQGYRYVRVATDILLIAIGTSMVIDAIDDLGRL